MKNCVVRPTLVLVCVVLLALPLFAQHSKGGGGGSTGCAIITPPDLSTSTALAGGDSIGIFSRVTNCVTSKGRYTVTISAVSSCGEETIIASSVISFSAGESKLVSVAYPVAPDTCKGMGSVYVKAYAGSTMLASSSAALDIQ